MDDIPPSVCVVSSLPRMDLRVNIGEGRPAIRSLPLNAGERGMVPVRGLRKVGLQDFGESPDAEATALGKREGAFDCDSLTERFAAEASECKTRVAGGVNRRSRFSVRADARSGSLTSQVC